MSSLSLENARVGDTLRILAITDNDTAMVAMRLGIAAGETLYLASKIPGGPLVIRRAGMEIALGRDLCKGIAVEKIDKAKAATIQVDASNVEKVTGL